jgi:hypothetical protein
VRISVLFLKIEGCRMFVLQFREAESFQGPIPWNFFAVCTFLQKTFKEIIGILVQSGFQWGLTLFFLKCGITVLRCRLVKSTPEFLGLSIERFQSLSPSIAQQSWQISINSKNISFFLFHCRQKETFGRTRDNDHGESRVARWYIFKPKIQVWVNFCGSFYWCRYVYQDVGIFYDHLVYFLAI